jgi:single-stranded-DNA-specific exonuclease
MKLMKTNTTAELPLQRWHVLPSQDAQAQEIAHRKGLLPIVAQVILNRGLATPEQVQFFLDPEQQVLPSPLDEFKDLEVSLELLEIAIAQHQAIAICGDYDADGMTSTALLLRALRALGAQVDYAIPSRMQEGYGINQRIVEELAAAGVRLILTVDNGIAAPQPIARARELGVSVIVTDHHELPSELPPANAILNPKLLPEQSLYYGLAGVGVAYILAISLAQRLGKQQGLSRTLLELFTLGTIADLAPLVGVNRRWVKRGLGLLPQSQLMGVQALIQVAGLAAPASSSLKPDDIGFRLGPRINAVGRIADPQVVIDLLTTDNPGIALERAMQCEQINQQRQQLCEQIEREAIQRITDAQINFEQQRVLVLVEAGWHHGVIGIVASRLVERFGVPVFIGTYEDAGHMIRGSARSIPEFHVFEALEFCHDLLHKYGGHKAAGGFSLVTENLEALRSQLQRFARTCLQLQHLKPLVQIDAYVNFEQLDWMLYQQLNVLHPCGMDNPNPVFATTCVRVLKQQRIGKDQSHLKLSLVQETPANPPSPILKALAWRWGNYYPLPDQLDIVYRLRANDWQGETTIELELIGAKQPDTKTTRSQRKPVTKSSFLTPGSFVRRAELEYAQRRYTCQLFLDATGNILQIENTDGHVLVVQENAQFGQLTDGRNSGSKTVDVSQLFYQQLIQAALSLLADDSIAGF